jgi:hypothetical protein
VNVLVNGLCTVWRALGLGPDFFIALGDHPEWGTGHIVFGRVY